MTTDELSALCRGLQAFMRLSDWRIDVDFARPRDLKRRVWARTDWSADQMTARIRIRSEEAQKRAHMKVEPIGWTLAHELTHLKLEGHAEENESLHTSPYEAGVDHLAEIVWKAYERCAS